MENYGIFKHLCNENDYSAMAKFLSSARCSKETRKTLKPITHKNICFGHMGQLLIKDGIAYASFLQNYGDDGESHASTTNNVVLSVFSVDKAMADDFDPDKDVLVYPIGNKGDSCAGYTASSIYKDNSMCLIGDTLYICFSFTAEDGISRTFCKSFDIQSRTWLNETVVTLQYQGQNMDFSDASLNKIYESIGIEPRAKSLIELVSAWNEYQGEYYATGITCGGPCHGFIVKTKDFCTMEFVDTVPFNDMGTAEIGSYIFQDKLYVACRQDYSIPYLYLGALNLKTMKWDKHYKLADGNARPWFFEYKDELYLWNTCAEAHRRYANISKVRTTKDTYPFYDDFHPVEIMATLKDCGYYYSTAMHNGDIYYVSSTGLISFGKLCLDFFDEDEISEKLLSMFE